MIKLYRFRGGWLEVVWNDPWLPPPIKTRLIEAMDSASIEEASQEFHDIMRGKTTAAISAHIEERLRETSFFPISSTS
ncbi:hypothetical protein AWV80_23255 [Cupriavidus sp. UYMU48A]|nr:hypothetical protein AWV80_23255 [Cupriavidus sp. UYMU48A]